MKFKATKATPKINENFKMIFYQDCFDMNEIIFFFATLKPNCKVIPQLL